MVQSGTAEGAAQRPRPAPPNILSHVATGGDHSLFRRARPSPERRALLLIAVDSRRPVRFRTTDVRASTLNSGFRGAYLEVLRSCPEQGRLHLMTRLNGTTAVITDRATGSGRSGAKRLAQ